MPVRAKRSTTIAHESPNTYLDRSSAASCHTTGGGTRTLPRCSAWRGASECTRECALRAHAAPSDKCFFFFRGVTSGVRRSHSGRVFRRRRLARPAAFERRGRGRGRGRDRRCRRRRRSSKRGRGRRQGNRRSRRSERRWCSGRHDVADGGHGGGGDGRFAGSAAFARCRRLHARARRCCRSCRGRFGFGRRRVSRCLGRHSNLPLASRVCFRVPWFAHIRTHSLAPTRALTSTRSSW